MKSEWEVLIIEIVAPHKHWERFNFPDVYQNAKYLRICAHDSFGTYRNRLSFVDGAEQCVENLAFIGLQVSAEKVVWQEWRVSRVARRFVVFL
jgi:hypothetical protein